MHKEWRWNLSASAYYAIRTAECFGRFRFALIHVFLFIFVGGEQQAQSQFAAASFSKVVISEESKTDKAGSVLSEFAKFGFGLRAFVENSFTGEGKFVFDVNTVRLYSKFIYGETKLTINASTQKSGGRHIVRLLDGILQIENLDGLNLWMGRHVSPNSRSNLSGVFYLSAWDFPFVERYPTGFGGRDVGLTFWGKQFDQRLTYYLGLYRGLSSKDLPLSEPLATVRVMYALWDIESGYYTSNSYLGKKEIISIGVSTSFQSFDQPGEDAKGRLSFVGIDALFEKRIAENNVLTFETGLSILRTNNISTPQQIAGNGMELIVAYCFLNTLSISDVQPFLRLQRFFGENNDGYECGLNCFQDGQNTRIGLVYSVRNRGGTNEKVFKIGLQIQR